MPDINEKLDRFRQIVLEDAAAERAALLGEVTREREIRLQEAEAQIKRETDELVQSRSTAITAELGREESRRLLADQRAVATRREEIAQEAFELGARYYIRKPVDPAVVLGKLRRISRGEMPAKMPYPILRSLHD